VSVDWNYLIRSPSLWTDVDLTQIPGHREGLTGQRHQCRRDCQDAYESRVSSLLTLLSDIDPPVHQLSFTYDIYGNHNR